MTLCLACLWAVLQSGPPPTLVRIAIVDTSGSMSPERLPVVQRELKDLVAKLPASPEHPLLLVTFNSTAAPTRVFVDSDTALAAIDALHASGGTRIAAGLAQGIKDITPYLGSAHLWVLLYTDGEDSDQAGILAEEAKLDALFADRQQAGLQQTVVLKRWGNANGLLQQQIATRGRATVVDAGEAQLAPLVIDPHLELAQVRWSSDRPGWLDVEFRAAIRLPANSPMSAPLAFAWRCEQRDVTGETQFSTPADESLPPLRKIQVKASTDPAVATMRVPFALTVPPPTSDPQRIVVPLLPAGDLSLEIPIPSRHVLHRYRVQVQPGTPAWIDPLTPRVAYPLDLSLIVETVNPQATDAKATFEISPLPPTAIRQGGASWTIDQPGVHRHPLQVEAECQNPASPPDAWRFRLRLRLRPTTTRAGTTFDPPELVLDEHDLRPPAPVTTDIVIGSTTFRQAQWVNPARSVATAALDATVDVRGPIPPQSIFTVLAPPHLSAVDFQPRTLHAGPQTIRITMTGMLPPAPDSSRLLLHIQPPPAQGAVNFRVQGQLTCNVSGPPPLQLSVANGRQRLHRFAVSVHDDRRTIEVPLQCLVDGIPTGDWERELGIMPQIADSTWKVSTGPLPLGQTRRVRIEFPPLTGQDFFQDSAMSTLLDLHPDPATPAVLGSRYPLTVVREAPFKRLLLQLTISVSAVLSVLFLAWFATRTRGRA